MSERKNSKHVSTSDIATQLQKSLQDVGTLPKHAVKITEKMSENKPKT